MRTVVASQFLAAQKRAVREALAGFDLSIHSGYTRSLLTRESIIQTFAQFWEYIYIFFFWNLLAIFLPISRWLQMSTKCQLLLFEALMMDLKYYSNFWFQNPLFWSSWCSSPSLSISRTIGRQPEAWSNPNRSNLGDFFETYIFQILIKMSTPNMLSF